MLRFETDRKPAWRGHCGVVADRNWYSGYEWARQLGADRAHIGASNCSREYRRTSAADLSGCTAPAKLSLRGLHSYAGGELAAMSINYGTGPIYNAVGVLRGACHCRWPGRHIAGLAWLLKCSKSSAAKYLAGQRRMQPEALERLAETLRHDGNELLRTANDVAYISQQFSSQPRRARGFQLLSEGGTDGRWRGGRPKGAKDRRPRRRHGGRRPD